MQSVNPATRETLCGPAPAVVSGALSAATGCSLEAPSDKCFRSRSAPVHGQRPQAAGRTARQRAVAPLQRTDAKVITAVRPVRHPRRRALPPLLLPATPPPPAPAAAPAAARARRAWPPT